MTPSACPETFQVFFKRNAAPYIGRAKRVLLLFTLIYKGLNIVHVSLNSIFVLF